MFRGTPGDQTHEEFQAPRAPAATPTRRASLEIELFMTRQGNVLACEEAVGKCSIRSRLVGSS